MTTSVVEKLIWNFYFIIIFVAPEYVLEDGTESLYYFLFSY